MKILYQKLYEAINTGIQKSFNFEIENDNDDFKIKKSKLKATSIDEWIYEHYQQKYKEMVDKRNFQGCLDLYNSGELNQKPRTIGYKIDKTYKLYDLVSFFDDYCWNNFDLNWIDVSEITDMSQLFLNRYNFNCNISEWDVSNVTDMSYMFAGCTVFNQPLNNWNVSNVTNMSYMFYGCKSFNQPLNRWDVSKLKSNCNIFNCCLLSEKNKPNFENEQ